MKVEGRSPTLALALAVAVIVEQEIAGQEAFAWETVVVKNTVVAVVWHLVGAEACHQPHSQGTHFHGNRILGESEAPALALHEFFDPSG